MANLKELKNRIESVKSTQKITGAMKLVAAAKLKRARDNAERAEPYADRMARMLSTLASNTSPDNAPALLVGNGSDQKHLLVVITSDRGLCGNFNSSIAKQVRQHVKELKAEGKVVSLLCLGRKGYELLKGDYKSIIIDHVSGLTGKKDLSFVDIEKHTNQLFTMFENGEFDVCRIFHSHFESAISQKVREQQLIPLPLEVKPDNDNTSGVAQAVYEFEPSENEILQELLPRNVNVQVFRAILDNAASEHGARMSAMDNATRNAGDMIGRLTLLYNRSRQAEITTELTEIIAGAEAV